MIPIAFYFVRYRINSKIKGFAFFLFYLAYCLINEGINYYLNDIKKIDTFIFFNFFSIIEFLFFAYFFWLLYKNQKGKLFLLVATITYTVYFVIDFLLTNNYNADFASWPATIESIFLLIFSIYYLFEQINDTSAIFIYAKKSFWIVIAIIIYLSGTFFLFIYAQNLMHDDTFSEQYGIMNSVLYIIKNILITIAFIIPESTEELKLDYKHY